MFQLIRIKWSELDFALLSLCYFIRNDYIVSHESPVNQTIVAVLLELGDMFLHIYMWPVLFPLDN